MLVIGRLPTDSPNNKRSARHRSPHPHHQKHQMVQTLPYEKGKKGRNVFRNYHKFRFETMEFTSKPPLANQDTDFQLYLPRKYTTMAPSAPNSELSQSSIQQIQKQFSNSSHPISITSSIPTKQQ